MSGKKWMKHYPKEVKSEAVCIFFEGGMTQAEITAALELRSEGCVEVWARQYPIPTFQVVQEIVDDNIAFYNYEKIQLKTRQTPYQTRRLSE